MRDIQQPPHVPILSVIQGGGVTPLESVAAYKGVERRVPFGETAEHARDLRVMKAAQIVLDKLLDAYPNGCTVWFNRDGAPDKGYVVGVAGRETKWECADFNHDELYADIVDKWDYLDRATSRSISDPPISIGLWVHDGHVYCDVGIVHEDRVDAFRWGYENGQIAIWDLSEDADIYL